MKLPKLPKQNRQKEADFGLVFREWMQRNYRAFRSCTVELKDTRGKDRFDISEWKHNQRVFARMVASDRGCLIRVDGRNGEPDYNWYRNATAYVAIRYPQGSVIIDAKDIPDQKSLTYEKACLIAFRIIH